MSLQAQPLNGPFPVNLTLLHEDESVRRTLAAVASSRPGLHVTCHASVDEAAAALEKSGSDVLVLGADLLRGAGLDLVAAATATGAPLIILLASNEREAALAWDLRVFDCVLLPSTTDRIEHSLTRATDLLRARSLTETPLAGDSSPLERLLVRQNGRMLVVRTEEIDWIEAAGTYVDIHAGGRKYLVRIPLHELEVRLDPRRFLRVHRSTIVNVDRIGDLQPMFSGDYQLNLRDGTSLVLSRRYKSRLTASFGQPL